MKKLFFLIVIISIHQNYGMGNWHVWSAEVETLPKKEYEEYKPQQKRAMFSLVQLAAQGAEEYIRTKEISDWANHVEDILLLSSPHRLCKLRKALFYRVHLAFGYNAPEILSYFSKELVLSIIKDPLYRDDPWSQVYTKEQIRSMLKDSKESENQ